MASIVCALAGLALGFWIRVSVRGLIAAVAAWFILLFGTDLLLLAIAVGSGNLWHYFVALGFPPVVRVIILGVPSITTALCVLLFRALLRRRAWWSAVIAFPAASVTPAL